MSYLAQLAHLSPVVSACGPGASDREVRLHCHRGTGRAWKVLPGPRLSKDAERTRRGGVSRLHSLPTRRYLRNAPLGDHSGSNGTSGTDLGEQLHIRAAARESCAIPCLSAWQSHPGKQGIYDRRQLHTSTVQALSTMRTNCKPLAKSSRQRKGLTHDSRLTRVDGQDGIGSGRLHPPRGVPMRTSRPSTLMKLVQETWMGPSVDAPETRSYTG